MVEQDEIKSILEQIANHERRISSLEGDSIAKTIQTRRRLGVKEDNYSGPTGGVRYLISKRFFKEKRDLASVREQLSQEGYHYSRQAVHEALKTLSRPAGPLVTLKEGRNKTYVERK